MGINPDYYGAKYYYSDEIDGDILGKFMQDNKFPFLGKWIIGKDFAFQLCCATNSYFVFGNIEEVSKYTCKSNELWQKAKIELMKDSWNIRTDKSIENVKKDIGIKS